MPSLDVVSEVDMHELSNAVDQANREIGNRFDFKGSNSIIEQKDAELTLSSDSDFRIKQMQSILLEKLTKRKIDINSLDQGKIEKAGMGAKQKSVVRQGIDKEIAKKIVKLVKDSKLKLQAAIQGEQVRITGKKRDDLQQMMSKLREADLGLPLQFTNFRD
jgi:uncharacterized protein YajQ (UPF0234 family)